MNYYIRKSIYNVFKHFPNYLHWCYLENEKVKNKEEKEWINNLVEISKQAKVKGESYYSNDWKTFEKVQPREEYVLTQEEINTVTSNNVDNKPFVNNSINNLKYYQYLIDNENEFRIYKNEPQKEYINRKTKIINEAKEAINRNKEIEELKENYDKETIKKFTSLNGYERYKLVTKISNIDTSPRTKNNYIEPTKEETKEYYYENLKGTGINGEPIELNDWQKTHIVKNEII